MTAEDALVLATATVPALGWRARPLASGVFLSAWRGEVGQGEYIADPSEARVRAEIAKLAARFDPKPPRKGRK
jgi:hypothetical protein